MTVLLAVVQPPAKTPPAETQAESELNADDRSNQSGIDAVEGWGIMLHPRCCVTASALRLPSPVFVWPASLSHPRPFAAWKEEGAIHRLHWVAEPNQLKLIKVPRLFKVIILNPHSNTYPETSLPAEFSQDADAKSLQLKLKLLLKIDQNHLVLPSFVPFNFSARYYF